MKEYGISITDALKQGIAPSERAIARGDFLSGLRNLRPTEYGLEPYERVDAVPVGFDKIDFPFPQFFDGQRVSLLCTRDNVFRVDRSSQRWKLEPVNEADDIVPAGRWQFIDWGDAWYLFNGECVVYDDGTDKITDKPFNFSYTVTSPRIGAGCGFKGRNIMGDVDEDILSTFASELNETEAFFSGGPSVEDLGPNAVLWSSIGGGDLPYWFFQPTVWSYEDLHREIKRNEMGWMVMRWPGRVLSLKPLGDSVIVYGDNGITALRFTSGGGSVPSTFGRTEVADFGIKSRASVGGNNRQHVFVDSRGALWSLSPDLELQRLEYERLFKHSDEAVVLYEPQNQDFFISTEDTGYTLTGNGLFEHHQRICSVSNLQGKRYAVSDDTSNGDGMIASSLLDFGQAGDKTITQVEVDYRGPYKPFVDIQYRYNPSEPFAGSGWKQVNDKGVVTVRATAKEFRVLVYFPRYEDTQVDDLTVRFQLPDRRFRRGTRVNQAGT